MLGRNQLGQMDPTARYAQKAVQYLTELEQYAQTSVHESTTQNELCPKGFRVLLFVVSIETECHKISNLLLVQPSLAQPPYISLNRELLEKIYWCKPQQKSDVHASMLFMGLILEDGSNESVGTELSLCASES
jgi:hypothetical protein